MGIEVKEDNANLKTQMTAVALKLELAGKEISEATSGLERILRKLSAQNELIKGADLANEVKATPDKPVSKVTTREETVAEKGRTLDNLSSLEDKFKSLDKEVSKAKEILLLLKVENPKLEDRENIQKYTSGIETSLARLTTMNREDVTPKYIEQVKQSITNDKVFALNQKDGSLVSLLEKYKETVDKNIGEFNQISSELKLGLQAQAAPLSRAVAGSVAPAVGAKEDAKAQEAPAAEEQQQPTGPRLG